MSQTRLNLLHRGKNKFNAFMELAQKEIHESIVVYTAAARRSCHDHSGWCEQSVTGGVEQSADGGVHFIYYRHGCARHPVAFLKESNPFFECIRHHRLV